jgi:hypothetical protein
MDSFFCEARKDCSHGHPKSLTAVKFFRSYKIRFFLNPALIEAGLSWGAPSLRANLRASVRYRTQRATRAAFAG